jgi:hypothetical protein
VTSQRAQTRERAASAAQYILLGGFAAVAAGISAQGLTRFARTNMELAVPAVPCAGRRGGRVRGAAGPPRGASRIGTPIEALDHTADLRKTGILVAFDNDTPGRKAAVRARHLLCRTSERLQTIRRITGNQELVTVDEQMRSVANPELPQIASALPADAAFQITRTAERLGFTDYSAVLAEVANAVMRKTGSPKGNSSNATPVLVKASFPRPPPAAHVGAEPPAARMSRANSHPKPPRSKYLPSSRVVVPNFDYIA